MFSESLKGLRPQTPSFAPVTQISASAPGLFILRRVKLFLSEDTFISLANSLVHCQLDYCSPLLHNLLKSQLESLLKLQNQCACVILSQTRRLRGKSLHQTKFFYNSSMDIKLYMVYSKPKTKCMKIK